MNIFLQRPDRERSTGEISNMLSFSTRTVSYHLSKMSAAGILIPKGTRKARRYKLKGATSTNENS
ncbi:winged helix-turn-helix domain-containing protein [Leptospira santarosai]|uniref:winged helix-turn-helix domain-containing protein n=1 Tax=Leptospira santarosai TaxID=28183 RepID=UPI00077386EB|nr:winged helix-turn-helix domain-containing protein [Leptospira santarosai]